jgi:hypothetical protein
MGANNYLSTASVSKTVGIVSTEAREVDALRLEFL